MTTEQFESFLKSNIPLSTAMQIRVQEFSSARSCLVAPLAPNINDKNIAFGGSQAALAMLTAWSLIYRHHQINNLQGEVVVRKVESRFLKPGRSELVAVAESPELEHWKSYERGLERRGIGRILVEVKIHSADIEIFEFSGQFVGVKELR